MNTLSQRISDQKYSTNSEFFRSSKRYLLETVPKKGKLRIIDVGCGTGLNSEYLKKLGHIIIGVDISPVAIEQYKRKGFDGKIIDIMHGLDYGDHTFDCVFAS